MRTLAIVLNLLLIGLLIYLSAMEGGLKMPARLALISILLIATPIANLLALFRRRTAMRPLAIVLNFCFIGILIFGMATSKSGLITTGEDLLIFSSLVVSPIVSLLVLFNRKALEENTTETQQELQPATARSIFIIVTVFCGVFFGLPFLYLLYRIARLPWHITDMRYLGVGLDIFSYKPTTEAYVFGILTFVPPFVAYLYWDSKKRKARQNLHEKRESPQGQVADEPSPGSQPESPEKPKPAYFVRPEYVSGSTPPLPDSSEQPKPTATPSPSDPMKTPLIVGLCACVIILVALLIWGGNFSKESYQSQPGGTASDVAAPPESQYPQPYIGEVEIERRTLADANAAIERGVPSAADYNNRGMIRSKRGMHEKALLDFKKAVDLAPDFAEAYLNIGDTCKSLNDCAGAAAAYKKYLELNPNDPKRSYLRTLIKVLTNIAEDQKR